MLLALFYEYIIKLYILFIHIILINKCNSGVKKLRSCETFNYNTIVRKTSEEKMFKNFYPPPPPCWGGEHSTAGIVTQLQTGGP